MVLPLSLVHSDTRRNFSLHPACTPRLHSTRTTFHISKYTQEWAPVNTTVILIYLYADIIPQIDATASNFGKTGKMGKPLAG